MKTKFTLFIVLFFTIVTFSQNNDDKREKIKTLKVAYITEQLELTSKEAEKFWPIYNAYDEQKFKLHHEMRKGKFRDSEENDLNSLTEQDAAKLLAEIEKNEETLYLARKKFMNDVKKVLPAKKIIVLKKTEDDFNRKLLREFKGRKK